MFIFIAPPGFKDFVQDEDVQDYLTIIQHMGVPEDLYHHSMGIVLTNLMRDVYEIGDMTRMTGSGFNILFCLKTEEEYSVVDFSALELVMGKLAEFAPFVSSDQLTLITPTFEFDEELKAFLEGFADLFKENEVSKNLAIMTIGFAKDQLGLIADH